MWPKFLALAEEAHAHLNELTERVIGEANPRSERARLSSRRCTKARTLGQHEPYPELREDRVSYGLFEY